MKKSILAALFLSAAVLGQSAMAFEVYTPLKEGQCEAKEPNHSYACVTDDNQPSAYQPWDKVINGVDNVCCPRLQPVEPGQ